MATKKKKATKAKTAAPVAVDKKVTVFFFHGSTEDLGLELAKFWRSSGLDDFIAEVVAKMPTPEPETK